MKAERRRFLSRRGCGSHRAITRMKLFTVSGAVRLAGLIAVLAGIRLNAQDVTVTDLALHIPKNLRPTRGLSLRTLSRCLIRPVWRRATSRATCWCG